MANAAFAKVGGKFALGTINLDTDTIKAALISSAYTPSLTTHEFYSDISTNALNTPQTIANTTVSADGILDGDDITFTAVAAGSTATYIAIYKDTGVPTTSPLIALLDTISSFPVATNGGDIVIQWSSGANKILKIGA